MIQVQSVDDLSAYHKQEMSKLNETSSRHAIVLPLNYPNPASALRNWFTKLEHRETRR